MTIRDTAERLANLRLTEADLRAAGSIQAFAYEEADGAVDRGRARAARAVLMRYEDAVARLEARQPEHMPGPSLDRIAALVNYLDHPERTYPTIHVTGTNGKSTAARAAASIACASGLPTGLYLSPHLREVTERFSICGEDMTRARSSARRGSTSSRTWT